LFQLCSFFSCTPVSGALVFYTSGETLVRDLCTDSLLTDLKDNIWRSAWLLVCAELAEASSILASTKTRKLKKLSRDSGAGFGEVGNGDFKTCRTPFSRTLADCVSRRCSSSLRWLRLLAKWASTPRLKGHWQTIKVSYTMHVAWSE